VIVLISIVTVGIYEKKNKQIGQANSISVT